MRFDTAVPISVWVQAIRPKTLLAGATPVLVATVLVSANERVHFGVFLAALSFALTIQIATNLINDVCDFRRGADTASRKGPPRVIQMGLVQEGTLLSAIAVVIGIAAAIGIYLIYIGGLALAIIAPISLLLSAAYTAGPFPLAYNGLGDIFVLIFFGPVAVGATYFLQTGHVTADAVFAGAALGCISTGILTVNNIRDWNTDRAVGKRTLVVRFGIAFGRIEYATLLFAAPLIVLLGFWSSHPGAVLCAAYLLPAKNVMRRVLYSQDGEELNSALAETARLLLLFAVLFCVGYCLYKK